MGFLTPVPKPSHRVTRQDSVHGGVEVRGGTSSSNRRGVSKSKPARKAPTLGELLFGRKK